MDLSQEFRLRAERCLELAREAMTVESHAHWIAMAQLWLNLGNFAEELDGLPASPPLANAQPKAQEDSGER
jgi:hypothetical protein